MKRTFVLVTFAALFTGCGKEPVHDGKPLSSWREQLRSPDVNARRAALGAIGTIGPDAKKAVPDLAALLKDADEKVRVDAAQALWSMSDDAAGAIPDLVAALKDKTADVRYHAA